MPSRVALTEVTPGSTGSWVDVDVSALVPAGATGVVVYFNNLAGTAQAFGLRKKGSTDDRRARGVRPGSHNWASIGVDSSRLFQCWVEDATNQNLYLGGFYGTEAVFFDNATELSLSSFGSYVEVDISSLTGDDTAIAAFLELESAANEAYALRMNGSSDDRAIGGLNKAWAMIGVDGSQIFEAKATDTDNNMWLNGYLKSGATMNTNATDVSIGATGAWTDLAALPAGGIAGIYECPGTVNSQTWGLRRNGDSESNVLDSHQHGWGICFADDSRIVEHQIGNTDRDLFLLGYFTAEATFRDSLLLFVPYDNEPQAGNYALLGLRNGHPTLVFDDTTAWSAVFTGIMPANYRNATGITVLLTATAIATSGTMGWTVELERMDAGTDLDADSFAAAQTVTAQTVPATAGAPLTLSLAIAKGANMDSIVAGDLFRLRIKRDVANDTAIGNVELLGVAIRET